MVQTAESSSNGHGVGRGCVGTAGWTRLDRRARWGEWPGVTHTPTQKHTQTHTHTHTDNHRTDYTNFNNVQTHLFIWTRLVHQLWVTEKRYLVYQLVEEFVASARWTVRHKEVPAGNTEH